MNRVLLLVMVASTLFAAYKEGEGARYTYESAKSYCSHLDGEKWRVASIKELFALRGMTQEYSKDRAYWSRNTVNDGKSQSGTGSEGDGGLQEGSEIGYTFYLQDGDVTLSPLGKRAGVICTDRPLQVEKIRYTAAEEGVADRQNNIIWMPLDAGGKKRKFNFEEARLFCEENGYMGREWRLPGVDELYGIVDYAYSRPAVDRTLFGVMMNRYYWSDDEFGEDQAYVVGFKLGSVATSSKKNSSYVRCVSDMEQ